MENNNILENIKLKIKNKKDIVPFLFLWNNIEILNEKVFDLASLLCKDFSIPKTFIYRLEDDWEKIKINPLKEFIKSSNITSSYDFQIFLIENISRLTLQSSNSLLKFLEEPWVQNIVFLTNSSESWILDTILSRVQIINYDFNNYLVRNDFFQSLLKNFFYNWNEWKIALFSYFYKNNLEKDEYIDFLKNIVYFSKDNLWLWIENLLADIDTSIYSIKNNNVNAKYVVDSFLIKLSNL